MKTSMLRSFRFWWLALCCVVLSAAHAQEVDPEPTDPGPTLPGSVHWEDSSHYEHGRHHRHGDDVVSIGHSAELFQGQHANNVVSIFGTATSAGEVDDSVVSILGGTRVTGRVGSTAVAIMGRVYVNGEVDNDVVAVLGSVELGPEARIRGDVVVVGGELIRDPKAQIDGHVQTVIGTDLLNFDWLRPWIERCLLYGRPLAFAPGLDWAWSIALGLLALYAFLALLFTRGVDRCVQTLETHPGQSILAALLTVLLTPVTIVLLCVTVLGILAIPFLAFGLLCAALLGKVVVLASIGRRCTPFLADRPVPHTVIGVLVGGLIALLLYTIPVVGFLLYEFLGILGLGVVVYTLLLVMRAGRAARNGGGGAPGSVPPGAASGAYGSAAAGRAQYDTTADARGSAFGPTGATFGATGAAGSRPGGASFAFGATDSPSGAAESTSAHAGPTSGAAGSTFGASGSASGPAGPAFGAPGTPGAGPHAASPPINPLSLPRAGFWIRMGSLLLDAIIVGIVVRQFSHGTDLNLVVLAAYGAVMWKLKSATVGGIICSLQVVRLDGRPIDWPTAIVRALSCFLSLAVVGLGFLWIVIDENKQSWHDKIAGTVVVHAPKGASLL
jgi:uncharacterized RDD family membrane protein YckC